jgi:tRNA 2-selenouridine synthase
LEDRERHLVGIAFKEQGQSAAINLAQELTAPHQQRRIAAWRDLARTSSSGDAIVMCWRGGLRSLVACQRLAEVGVKTRQLRGGYKALRQVLLEHLSDPPPCLVLTGLTGAGKTALIHELNRLPGAGMRTRWALDLEEAAAHRGSAFGGDEAHPQPAQASFENMLALQVAEARRTTTTMLVEDESRMIGRLTLPSVVLKGIATSPVVILDEGLDVRSHNLFDEYLRAPLAAGIALKDLHAKAQKALASIRSRLDREAPVIQGLMDKAFANGSEAEAHQLWIEALLVHYYDKRYRHGIARYPREVVFQGDRAACRAWLADYLQHQAFHG